MDAVCDATALIYLAKADRIAVAAGIVGPLLAPPAVWDEAVRVGALRGHSDADAILRARKDGAVVQLEPSEVLSATAARIARMRGLDAGESEALAAARLLRGEAVIDERRARKAAARERIPAVRTATLAVRGMERGALDYHQARDLLEAIVAVAPMRTAELLPMIKRMEALRDGD